MFTPMTRRALSTAQQEQERLGHAAVEPAHLLLALLKVRLEVGDWGHFFWWLLFPFISFMSMFFFDGLDWIRCFVSWVFEGGMSFGWFGGLGMEGVGWELPLCSQLVVVRPEHWTVKIVKTQLRDVIVVRNFASLWFVPIPNSSACSISGSRAHHGCKSMKTGMEPWNLYFWAAGWVNLFTLAIKHGLLENHPICNRWFSYINTHLVEPVV